MKLPIVKIKELRVYATSPEIKALWILLILQIGVSAIAIMWAPLLFGIIAIIVGIGLVIAITSNQIRLAALSHSTTVANWEFSSVIQNLDDGIIVYNQSFTIISFNKASENILGIATTDVIKKTIGPHLLNDPKYALIAQVMFPSLAPRVTQLSDPQMWPQSVLIATENPVLDLLITLHRITDSKGSVVGFLKIIHDKTREQEMINLKNEFINTAAHQLRTPLTALRWGIESVKKDVEGVATEDTKSTLTEMMKLSDRTLKITNDLLDAAKIEEGKFGYNFERVNIISTLQTVVEEARPIGAQVNVAINLSPHQENIELYCDPNRIAMAFSNILDNAIKYNVQGGAVTVRTEMLRDKPYIKVLIEDTGIGVPPAEIDKLFHKLHRGSNVAQQAPNGSGLGLYITKNIIERHGGAVGVTSIINRGSVFWFTLPIDPSLVPLLEFKK